MEYYVVDYVSCTALHRIFLFRMVLARGYGLFEVWMEVVVVRCFC